MQRNREHGAFRGTDSDSNSDLSCIKSKSAEFGGKDTRFHATRSDQLSDPVPLFD